MSSDDITNVAKKSIATKNVLAKKPTDTKTIISAAELATKLTDYVILDCRFSLSDTAEGERLYHEDHIPEAYYCHLERNLSAPVKEHGGRHPLPDPTVFSQQLHAWGIQKNTPVVVYDDQRFAFASRAWWLLKAVGIENVFLLNGGYRAWRAEQFPVETLPPSYKSSGDPAITHLDLSNTVNFDLVLQSLPEKTYTLIDSREAPRYRGESEPIDPVAGHIPGAINKPWGEITAETGFIQPQEFHDQRWQDITDEKPLVIYCGSGVTACVNMLSAQLAGKAALLYPGSWSDWCSYNQAPVARDKRS